MEMIKTKLNGKFEMYLPEHRANRPEWHNEIGWEKARLQSMSENIGKGDVVYYIGAELGEMAALCQIWGAEVILFEPNHLAWPVIRAIWEANKLTTPKCFAGFASNVDQPIPPNPDLELWNGKGWEIQPDGWPLCSKGEINPAHGFSELYQEANGLPQFKIDILVERGVIEPPTLITLDVEGSEFEVLRGAEKTIDTHKPIIELSLHPEFLIMQYGEYSRNLRDWIIDKGYDEKFLDWKHEAHFEYIKRGV